MQSIKNHITLQDDTRKTHTIDFHCGHHTTVRNTNTNTNTKTNTFYKLTKVHSFRQFHFHFSS